MLEDIFEFLILPVPAIVVAILIALALLVFPMRYLISRARRGLIETQDDALNAIGMELAELKNTCVALKYELHQLKHNQNNTEDLEIFRKDVIRKVELKLNEFSKVVGNAAVNDHISRNSLKTEKENPASINKELTKLNKSISVATALLMELRHESSHSTLKAQ